MTAAVTAEWPSHERRPKCDCVGAVPPRCSCYDPESDDGRDKCNGIRAKFRCTCCGLRVPLCFHTMGVLYICRNCEPALSREDLRKALRAWLSSARKQKGGVLEMRAELEAAERNVRYLETEVTVLKDRQSQGRRQRHTEETP